MKCGYLIGYVIDALDVGEVVDGMGGQRSGGAFLELSQEGQGW